MEFSHKLVNEFMNISIKFSIISVSILKLIWKYKMLELKGNVRKGNNFNIRY